MYFFGSAYGYGAFINNHFVVFQDLSQVIRHAEDVFQVGGTVFSGRSGKCEENDLGISYTIFEAGGEAETLFLYIPQEEFFQAGLINGDLSVRQLFNFSLVDVHAGYIIASFGKTSTGYQTYVSGTYNSDFHFEWFLRVSGLIGSLQQAVHSLSAYNCDELYGRTIDLKIPVLLLSTWSLPFINKLQNFVGDQD